MYNQQIPPFGGGFGFRPPQPMQGYYPPQPIPQPTAPSGPGVTLVTDRQQADVAVIPFDGQPVYYHNTSTDEVYVKRFDPNTGKSPVVVYRRAADMEERPAYAPMAALEDLMRRVAALEGAPSDYQPRRMKEENAE